MYDIIRPYRVCLLVAPNGETLKAYTAAEMLFDLAIIPACLMSNT